MVGEQGYYQYSCVFENNEIHQVNFIALNEWKEPYMIYKPILVNIKLSSKHYRVATFNPTKIFEAIRPHISVFKRSQGLPMQFYFKSKDGFCACGCGNKLTGRKTVWHSSECNDFGYDVYAILNGQTGTLVNYLNIIHGYICKSCGTSKGILHADHIVAVMNGGGFSWLNNFQLLCSKCHKIKTIKDHNQRRIKANNNQK
jgi:5-methylcytosine-specific restriction endonuclease McrA